MLKKLRKKEEFEKVYKKGITFLYGNIVIRFLKNGLGFSRIGVVVSGRFSKKAVERNKIKRQLRYIFQKERLLFEKNIDIVVLPKKGKTNFRLLRENTEKALKKAKIIT